MTGVYFPVPLLFTVGCLLLSPLAAAEQARQGQTPLEQQAEVDSLEARKAADSAAAAAHVAKQVAAHSVTMTYHAKAALKKAQEALHSARVETDGLSDNQTKALKDAEDHLREASKITQFGKGNSTESKLQEKLDKLKKKMKEQAAERRSELDQMRQELRELRHKLKGTNEEKQLEEIEEMLKELEEQDEEASLSNDELKAELERLREAVKKLQKKHQRRLSHHRPAEIHDVEDEVPPHEEEVHIPEQKGPEGSGEEDGEREREAPPATPASGNPIDIDTEMPYGDLEPFGREDTAQELTEASIRESDAMVDQLERAEVAEEKRAIFRALTRLRGAAITSFDGMARAQTGNIDEYNKVHQWRATHPLHHLANDESDISKWAFPDANF